jgi:diguanylate cyclase (GGDEF)-like protein/hemerythrin-like metal-binding protein
MYRVDIPDIFARFLATQDIGLAVKGLDGRYLYANPGYARLLGISADAVVQGRQDEDLLPEPAACALVEAQASVQSNAAAVGVDFPPGSREEAAVPLLVTHFPVLDVQGQLDAIGVVAVPRHAQRLAGDEAEQALRTAEKTNAELESALRSLQELASTDGLTKAWNRRRFEEALEGETHRAVRFGHPLSLAVVDIDHFKSVNDNFGHPVGDRVLAEFVDCLREGMRKSDSVTRWGGEEFIILMPNTPLQAAQRSAERLRERVEQHQFRGVGALTASIGVAQFAPAETTSEWLRRADDALYRAKKRGRNLVETDRSTAAGPESEHIEGNLVRLVWKQRFCSGHPLIDAQHRALFEDANALLDAVLTDRPADEVETLIERLIDDVARHFRDEELVLAQVGFAHCEAHAAEHAALLARARDMAAAYRARALSSGELFHFLAYDLVARHLLGADRAFFPSIAARRG